MNRKIVRIISVLFIAHLLVPQINAASCLFDPTQDTVSHPLLHKMVLPAGFILSGVVLNHSTLEINLQENIRTITGPDFHVQIDDYIQWAPIAEMYLGDVFHLPAKNHWFDQSKNLFFANLLSGSVTYGLKRATHKIRPNGGDESFPSGHTTFAFTNATVLFEEYRDQAPLFAKSGYVFATSTGLLRMLNNRHWLSDVLTGAGIGIISAQLVYWFEPFKNFNPFLQKNKMNLIPAVDEGAVRLYFICRL